MRPQLQSRKAALRALHAVLREGKEAPHALEQVFKSSDMTRQDRAFTQALVMGVLRHLRVIDALLDAYLSTPINENTAALVKDGLRLGVAQLLFLDVPPHAAVFETVELVKQSSHQALTKLVNGVLQRVVREGQDWLETAGAAYPNLPEWLWQRWVRNYGEVEAQAMADSLLTIPALDISVKGNAQEWAEKLGGEVLPTGSVRLHDTGDVSLMEGYKEGAFWVQDVAASLPVKLLGDVNGKRVLDMCAAPGGKTAQLAVAGAQVVAIDKSPRRVKRLQENLKRLALEAEIVVEDALTYQAEGFDAVLVDAPCSATGTLRRHPEIAFRRSEQDIAELVQVQQKLIAKAASQLKKGGVMVYATCSLEPEEGEAQLAFMEAQGLTLSPIAPSELGGEGFLIRNGIIRALPHYYHERGGMDGFFAARMVKA